MDIMVIDGNVKTWEEAISLSADALYEHKYVKESFKEACIKREIEFPTGLPCKFPVAIPHTDAEHVNKDCLCFLRLNQNVKFTRIDDKLKSVNCKMIINMALSKNESQVEMLSKLIKLIKDNNLMENCYSLSASKAEKELRKIIK
ncbi:PTS sugar transporter subunit IIA [Anaerofustis stercorihominis]|uniref:Phosphoenolpyruvate-dependent sugar phosphotransferase system, EIIA 2 n=2 Tax=Anaerofustis stercorihominis TaxID=214853 RepID=B1C8V1_9FIRM|nr:PTS sugar transporter subunit IIA [Anaerofustis stercorihominis]EDS72011.1 phosphoenolpyruvate-dependent sugar phosphotransferase system, EIIA 2 [Anaerofustis stercorihominis DSM 17244]MCQ4795938.1 PTS sugar transporter subunit IIA [Anaerofustis stercorihominis]RGD74946.1 PTS sugar transporter subunit IIA [Anaerofustis stercorihominis]